MMVAKCGLDETARLQIGPLRMSACAILRVDEVEDQRTDQLRWVVAEPMLERGADIAISTGCVSMLSKSWECSVISLVLIRHSQRLLLRSKRRQQGIALKRTAKQHRECRSIGVPLDWPTQRQQAPVASGGTYGQQFHNRIPIAGRIRQPLSWREGAWKVMVWPMGTLSRFLGVGSNDRQCGLIWGRTIPERKAAPDLASVR